MDFERVKKLDTLRIHLEYDLQHIEWIKRLKDDFAKHANECADSILERYKDAAQ